MWAVLSIVPPSEFVEHAVEFGLSRPLLHDGVQVRMEQLVVFKSSITAAGSPLVQIVERLSEVVVQQLLQVKFAGFCDGDISLTSVARSIARFFISSILSKIWLVSASPRSWLDNM